MLSAGLRSSAVDLVLFPHFTNTTYAAVVTVQSKAPASGWTAARCFLSKNFDLDLYLSDEYQGTKISYICMFPTRKYSSYILIYHSLFSLFSSRDTNW